MKKKFVFVNVLIAITVMITTPACAGDYFDFKLGIAKRSEVINQLQSAGAQFDPGYSYKGRGDLYQDVLSHLIAMGFNDQKRTQKYWHKIQDNQITKIHGRLQKNNYVLVK